MGQSEPLRALHQHPPAALAATSGGHCQGSEQGVRAMELEPDHSVQPPVASAPEESIEVGRDQIERRQAAFGQQRKHAMLGWMSKEPHQAALQTPIENDSAGYPRAYGDLSS